MRILVVEQDADFRRFLTGAIEEAGYQVDAAHNIPTAIRLGMEVLYNCLVVDFSSIPEKPENAIQQLEQAGLKAPILALTSARSLEERLHLLEIGASDLMARPFALPEFVARLRNLLPKEGSSGQSSTRLRVVDLELDLLRREVTRGGRLVELTTQEFALLEYLCRNAGKVVTRSMMLESIWNLDSEPNPSVIDVHISRLRAKVDGRSEAPLIYTVRGLGYVVRNFDLESETIAVA